MSECTVNSGQLQNISAQRIVFSDDIDALLSAVAWIGSPGNRDPWEDAPGPESAREQSVRERTAVQQAEEFIPLASRGMARVDCTVFC